MGYLIVCNGVEIGFQDQEPVVLRVSEGLDWAWAKGRAITILAEAGWSVKRFKLSKTSGFRTAEIVLPEEP